ncbi:MAG: hypothetical protein ACLP8S_32265 [Solirubrobacteraceae bacterium]|jgi:hypothetical protein
MFTAAHASRDADPHVGERDGLSSRASTGISGLSRRRLDQIYVGKRQAGVPTVLVVRDTGAEYMPAPERGAFGWGWPSTGGARRLAHALLLDLTGRNAPPWVADKIAARELGQLPRAAFSITGRQILGWIGFYGYSISEWPPAQRSLTPSPIHGTTRDAPDDAIARKARREVPGADMSPAFETRTQGAVRDCPATVDRLWLRATERGWSLITSDGVVVFGGIGPASRRQCLRRAYGLGVLAVLA